MAYTADTSSTDGYQELSCPGTRQVTVQISNAAISIGYGTGGDGRRGTATFGNDEVLLPTVGAVYRPCDAIRFRSYVAGKPANVKIAANP